MNRSMQFSDQAGDIGILGGSVLAVKEVLTELVNGTAGVGLEVN